MQSITLLFGISFLIFVVVFATENGPEVTIEQGILRGKIGKSRHGKTFSAFTGIPYAKPPVGKLRFKVSVGAEPWEGIFDATKPHAVCPQPDPLTFNNTIIGDEDCLYLNVYTPQLPGSKKDLLPVMLFIHGGSMVTGSAQFYGPDLLMDKEVVLVTINYRIGPLGFFTTEDFTVVGNDGLKDQYLSIKWTKGNIDKFGGDPNSITVFGQSAGGTSAHFHMLSPLTKDLIKGAIAQSGTGLAQWALMPYSLSTRRSKMLANKLGCPTHSTDEMLECLRKVDAHDIIKQTDVFVEWDVDPEMPMKPVIEPNLPGAYLAEDPIDIITSGRAANIPLMTGLTTDEGAVRTPSFFSNRDLLKEFDTDFMKIGPLVLMYSDSIAKKHIAKITTDIRKFYLEDKPIDESTKSEFTKMYSDSTILEGEDATVEVHVNVSKKPLYYYLFGYKGSASFIDVFNKNVSEDYGVCHWDDLLYLFNVDHYMPEYKPTDTDIQVADFLTTLWANFAKYGNPTPETDATISLKWEPVEKGKQNYLFIKRDGTVQMDVDLFPERAKFWRDLQLNVKRTKTHDEL